jgi:hypothetical protein
MFAEADPVVPDLYNSQGLNRYHETRLYIFTWEIGFGQGKGFYTPPC